MIKDIQFHSPDFIETPSLVSVMKHDTVHIIIIIIIIIIVVVVATSITDH
jgi:hypothetical protein